MSILAFSLCLGLYCLFVFVGSAAVRVLYARGGRIQAFLVSPIAGFGICLFPVFLLNKFAGIPVGKFGPVVLGLLLIGAGAIHYFCHRRRLPDALFDPSDLTSNSLTSTPTIGSSLTRSDYKSFFRFLAPFIAIVLFGAVFTGRPMFTHGFNWISFCNDDMANYTLAADRFLREGFMDPPSITGLQQGTDYAQTYWFLHVPTMSRAGAELLISFIVSWTGLVSQQVFMPLIIAFHMSAIGAAIALVTPRDDRKKIGIMAGILVVANAEMAFGVIYQLIAQAAGLAMVCTNIALLARPLTGISRNGLIRHGLLVGICLCTQLLIYPEINVFLAAGFFFYAVVALVRRKLNFKALFIVLTSGAIATLCILTTFIYDALMFMFNQKGAALASDKPTETLFPFFMLPSGIPTVFGLLKIAQLVQPAVFDVAIAVGLGLIVLLVVLSVIWTWKGEAAAGVVLFCVILGAVLFKAEAGFGLYKLAMYVQPFAMGTLAVWWGTRKSRRARVWLAILLLGPLAAVNLVYHGMYVRYSEDQGGATFNEVLGATRTGILKEFRKDLAAIPEPPPDKPKHLLVDTYNIVLGKLLSAYTRGWEAAFPATRLASQSVAPGPPLPTARQAVADKSREIHDKLASAYTRAFFEFDPEYKGKVKATIVYFNQGGRPVDRPDGPETWLFAGTKNISLFNRRKYINADGNFVVMQMKDVKNHLLFAESDQSQAYYQGGDTKLICIFQIESDKNFFPMDLIAGIGRYFLFEVLNPDEKVRFVVNLTASLKGDGQNELPPAAAIGVEKARMSLVGRGSARVFSPPITPVVIREAGGRTYVGIDMGIYGRRFPLDRDGLMSLFGTEVAMDRRQLLGFGRDISLIGESEFKNLKPPAGITRWAPDDRCELRHLDLEYSGIYEDGWVSEKSFVVLGQDPDRPRLVLRGMIPEIGDPNFKQTLTLKIDGKPIQFTGKQGDKWISNGTFGVGEFELEAPIPPTGEFRRRIEMDWTGVQHLPGKDQRPVSIKMTAITLEPKPPGAK